MILRWTMFGFCCCFVTGMIGWGVWLCFTDWWMGERMLPMCIACSLPTGAMGVFWLGRAKRWW